LDSIGPNDTVLTVRDTAVGLQIGAILTIDTGANAENVYIAALSGDTATVERNRGGPNIAHAAGAPLTESDSFHLNAKGYQIVANAVAQFLSSYAGQAKK
jgi:lysophospholipase L1-like esterase